MSYFVLHPCKNNMELNKQMKWKTNIHKIEMEILLNAILEDFDSFKAEIEKRRNEFENEIDDVSPRCRPLNV